jgi:Heparinase II/III-like protein/Heparinase II/III N-terminus
MAKRLRDRWVRLSSMTTAELLDRIRQHSMARLDAVRYRMGSRLDVAMRAHAQASRFFFQPADLSAICKVLWQRLPKQANTIIGRADKICRHRFDLLGYEDLDYGPEIDWHYDQVHARRAPRKPFYQVRYLDFGEVGDSKVTWELNRHQHLVTLAKAYRLTSDEKYAAELFRHWRHWHAENPYPVGVNWASSLEVAFRSISWLWMYFLLADCPVAPSGFREQWLRALGLNGRHIEVYLSTYFSPNTHLLGEAVALFFIGTLCPELEPSKRWQRLGWDIVVQEMDRQVHADGLHFEQSTYYHVYALDFFLHTRTLAVLNGIAIPKQFDDKLVKMLDALAFLSRAGSPPQLGDDDGGRLFDPRRNRLQHMLDPLATGAVLFQRGDWKPVARDIREETLWLLGTDGVAEFDKLTAIKPTSSSVALESSGLYIMSEQSQQLVIDAGPQGAATAGHGHADALSVCLNLNGQPVLIDPGTCEYVGDDSARDEFRGTSSHNTLCIDGLSQSDPKGPFAWTNLPSVRRELWISGRAFDLFVGSHNGYARLPEPVTHRRIVFWLKDKFWLVRDEADGTGQHKLELNWHLSPEFVQSGESNLVFERKDQSEGLAFVPLESRGWSAEVRSGWYSSAYGLKKPAPLLHFSTIATLPAEFVTLLLAGSGVPGELTRIEGAERAYRYRRSDEEYCICFGEGTKWAAGPWSSDAELLCWGIARGARCLIFCNGTYAEYSGNKILSSNKRVRSCEVTSTGGKTEIVSDDKQSIVLHHSLESISADSEAVLATMPGSSRTEA